MNQNNHYLRCIKSLLNLFFMFYLQSTLNKFNSITYFSTELEANQYRLTLDNPETWVIGFNKFATKEHIGF